MYRVLIVSESEQLVESMKQQLQSGFHLESCGSGSWALALMNDYSPDILVVDNVIVDLDCISVLQAVRASGKLVHIIVYSNFNSPYVERQLENLGVDMLVLRPCKLSALAGHIKGIAAMIENSTISWDIEQVLDNLLLELGFNLGVNRYRVIREVILLRYSADPKALMKELYLDIAQKCGGNNSGVEKAVRDAIKVARQNGDPTLWNLLFDYCTDEQKTCPSNEEFIGRIVLILRQRSRVKPSYKELPAKIV